jgi:arginine N-succinyltransferase
VVGEVGEETRGARHLLKQMGFVYKNEVDPFDGGPHFGCKLKDIAVVKKGKMVKVAEGGKRLSKEALLGFAENGNYYCAHTFVEIDKETVFVNLVGEAYLKDFVGKNVFCSLL